MKTKSILSSMANKTGAGAAAMGLAFALSASSAFAVIYPQQLSSSDLNYVSEAVTGVVLQAVGGGQFNIGSGAVVAHPKVVLTCAHVCARAGQWVPPGTLTFTARHHAAAMPANRTTLRDYFKYDSYSTAVRTRGKDSREAYNMDIVAGYAYVSFAGGYAAGYWPTGASVLTNARYWKKLTGYPYERTQNYFMHRVPAFTGSFRQHYGAFYTITGATSYGGNSGGPLYAWDPAKRDWFVAGVFVSSDRASFMGVRALDANGVKLLTLAKSAAGR